MYTIEAINHSGMVRSSSERDIRGRGRGRTRKASVFGLGSALVDELGSVRAHS